MSSREAARMFNMSNREAARVSIMSSREAARMFNMSSREAARIRQECPLWNASDYGLLITDYLLCRASKRRGCLL